MSIGNVMPPRNDVDGSMPRVGQPGKRVRTLLETRALDRLRDHVNAKMARLDLGNNEAAQEIGIDKGILSRVRSGERSPELGTLLKIRLWLGLTWEQMLEGKPGTIPSHDPSSAQPAGRRAQGQKP